MQVINIGSVPTNTDTQQYESLCKGLLRLIEELHKDPKNREEYETWLKGYDQRETIAITSPHLLESP